jgi:hypothetical protein
MRTNAAQIAKNANQKKHEKVEVLDSGPPPGDEEAVGPDEIMGRDGMQNAPAVDFATIEQEAKLGPPVKRYRVLKGGSVQTSPNSNRTFVKAGKEIDELNFDIRLMKQQGIELEELSATG